MLEPTTPDDDYETQPGLFRRQNPSSDHAIKICINSQLGSSSHLIFTFSGTARSKAPTRLQIDSLVQMSTLSPCRQMNNILEANDLVSIQCNSI